MRSFYVVTCEADNTPLYVSAVSMRSWPIWNARLEDARKFLTRKEALPWLRGAQSVYSDARIVAFQE